MWTVEFFELIIIHGMVFADCRINNDVQANLMIGKLTKTSTVVPGVGGVKLMEPCMNY